MNLNWIDFLDNKGDMLRPLLASSAMLGNEIVQSCHTQYTMGDYDVILIKN